MATGVCRRRWCNPFRGNIYLFPFPFVIVNHPASPSLSPPFFPWIACLFFSFTFSLSFLCHTVSLFLFHPFTHPPLPLPSSLSASFLIFSSLLSWNIHLLGSSVLLVFISVIRINMQTERRTDGYVGQMFEKKTGTDAFTLWTSVCFYLVYIKFVYKLVVQTLSYVIKSGYQNELGNSERLWVNSTQKVLSDTVSRTKCFLQH